MALNEKSQRTTRGVTNRAVIWRACLLVSRLSGANPDKEHRDKLCELGVANRAAARGTNFLSKIL
jgi:hypothetical protein